MDIHNQHCFWSFFDKSDEEEAQEEEDTAGAVERTDAWKNLQQGEQSLLPEPIPQSKS